MHNKATILSGAKNRAMHRHVFVTCCRTDTEHGP